MCIEREYWGPTSGQHKYTQRLFRVKLSGGSRETLVAQDLVDALPGVPFEDNPFYSDCLRAWREQHPNPPEKKN